MKANELNEQEKEAIIKLFGVPFPKDLTDQDIEKMANTLIGARTIIGIRLKMTWKKMKHDAGLCHKAKLGYRCYGRSNYVECGSRSDHD